MHRQDVFFGREREVELLLASESDRVRCDVLCGAPGVGKSALWHRYRYAARERGMFDEVIELDAREWLSEPEKALPEAWGLALGIGANVSREILSNVLGESVRRLLVIENAEWCDETQLAALLDDYTARMKSGRVLVLTRSLGAPWQGHTSYGRHEIGPLGDRHDPQAARELFAHHAQRPLEELEEEGLLELLEKLFYHPFSIELCAALCRWTGMAHVLTHIETIASEVTTSVQGATSIWSSRRVHALFAHSWEQVGERTRAGLREVAIFPMPVAATRVANFLGHRFELAEVLDQATRYGLISIQEGGDGVARIHMAHVFRVFCLDELEAHTSQRIALIEACSRALVRQHEHVPTHVALLDDLDALEDVRRDTSLIRRVCLDGSETTDAAVLLPLARICLAAHVMQESSLVVAEELQRIADLHEADARPEVSTQRTFLLIELALEELTRGYSHESISYLETLEARLIDIEGRESRRLQWWLSTQLVWARIVRAEYERAEERIAQMHRRRAALEERGILVEPQVMACLRMREASLLYQQGRDEEAVTAHEQAFHLAREAGDERSWAMLAHNLAVLYTEIAQLDEAERCLQWAMRHQRYLSVSFNALNEISLGMLYMRMGRYERARQHLTLARHKVLRGGLSGNLALIDINMANVELCEHETSSARVYVERAIMASRGHDLQVWAHANLMLANVLGVEQDHAGVLAVVDPVLEQLEDVPHVLQLRFCLLGMRLIAQLATTEDAESSSQTFAALERLRDELQGDRVFVAMFEHLENFVLLEHYLRASLKTNRAMLLQWLEHTYALVHARHLRHESLRVLDILRRQRLPDRLLGVYDVLWRVMEEGGRRWLIASDGVLACDPQGGWIDLSNHELLAQLLSLLGAPLRQEEDEALTLDELEASLWPGEKILPEAASNRLHVSLSRLRRRGFGVLIVRDGERYLLDPDASITWF